ncbi:MAG: hypothetical protein HYZ50_03505 [Deltaproteobacteria bacterium]|nr:hypothetical protein [Deltaproteobacteria bacterium]
MKFSEVVDRASEFLCRRERVSYRALKREFDLDDELLEDLKVELIDAKRLAVDEEGKVLVWMGATPVLSVESRVLSPPQSLIPRFWFTERFDTVDLHEAKTLLEELAEQ